MEETNNILIVDDNPENLKVASNFLIEKGYKIALALNAEDALTVLRRNRIDLILLDIMMPDVDGIELCQKIKKNKRLKEIPIIFLTGKNRIEDLEEGFKVGGVDYITKPFKREILLIRVKSHIDLYKSKKTILEMNQTRDKLFSIIAHDIRSPFINIIQIIDFMSKGQLKPDSEEFNNFFKLLKQTTFQTHILLNNLLEWTKFNSGTISLAPKATNIYELLSECIQLLNGNAQNKNISIKLNVSQCQEAYFDETTIHTAFRNIISNAIKFTNENGEIIIESENTDDSVLIRFQDNGIGMPAEKIKAFYANKEQVTSLGTNNERGTGLGLYIIKDFVEQNNGKISIESTEGTGTNFTVYLPGLNSQTM